MEVRAQIINPTNCLQANLRKATRAIGSHYSHLLKPSDVERTQLTMLFTIRGMGGPTISALAKFMLMDQTTATRKVQGLVRKGFVTLEQGEADKRTRYVALTSKGKATMVEALPMWQQAQSIAVDALGPEKATQLLDLLDELVEALESSN